MYQFIRALLNRFGSHCQVRQKSLSSQTVRSSHPDFAAFAKKFGQLLGILLLATAAAGIATLTSCDLLGGKTDDSLVGYWKSSFGDGFEIYGSYPNTKFKQYDDASKTVSFAGDIVNSPSLTASSGYLIIKITDGGTWMKTVGDYFAVHWKEFTGDTVKQATAYKVGGTNNNGMPTADAAAAEYTVENGYYTRYGDYQRQ